MSHAQPAIMLSCAPLARRQHAPRLPARPATCSASCSAHARSLWKPGKTQTAPQLLRAVPGQGVRDLMAQHCGQQVLVTVQQLDQACAHAPHAFAKKQEQKQEVLLAQAGAGRQTARTLGV